MQSALEMKSQAQAELNQDNEAVALDELFRVVDREIAGTLDKNDGLALVEIQRQLNFNDDVYKSLVDWRRESGVAEKHLPILKKHVADVNKANESLAGVDTEIQKLADRMYKAQCTRSKAAHLEKSTRSAVDRSVQQIKFPPKILRGHAKAEFVLPAIPAQPQPPAVRTIRCVAIPMLLTDRFAGAHVQTTTLSPATARAIRSVQDALVEDGQTLNGQEIRNAADVIEWILMQLTR